MEPKRPLAARQLGITMDFAQFMEACGRYGYALVDSYKMQVGALHCFRTCPPSPPSMRLPFMTCFTSPRLCSVCPETL